jgi:hypothetical protein
MAQQIYRIGTSLTLGALFMYSNIESGSQPYYDGRHWCHYQATSYNPSEYLNPLFASFTEGKWHQIGRVGPSF